MKPTPEEIGNAIKRLNNAAYSAAMNGSSDEPYMALITAIEWATGRTLTAKWRPAYVKHLLEIDDIEESGS